MAYPALTNDLPRTDFPLSEFKEAIALAAVPNVGVRPEGPITRGGFRRMALGGEGVEIWQIGEVIGLALVRETERQRAFEQKG